MDNRSGTNEETGERNHDRNETADILLFMIPSCPYCRQAFRWLAELQMEHPQYAALHIEQVDEIRESARANMYNYFLVPTFYVDGKKVHEGATTKEIIRRVLDEALAQHSR